MSLSDTRRRTPRERVMFLAADAVIVLLCYGGLFRQQFGADTMLRSLMPESDIGGDLDHARYLSYISEMAFLRLGINMTDHYRLFFSMLVFGVILDIFLVQEIFFPFLADSIRKNPPYRICFLVATALPFCNVLYIEKFMFPEYHATFAMADLLAVLGVYAVSKGRKGLGLLSIVASGLYYQTDLMLAALLLATWLVFESEFRLSRPLVTKVILYTAFIMAVGFLDNQSNRLMRLMGVINPENTGKVMASDHKSAVVYLAHQTADLLKSSQGLIPVPWAHLIIFVLALSVVLIMFLKRERGCAVTVLVLFVYYMIICYTLPFLAGEGVFYPRMTWLFYVPLGVFLAKAGEMLACSHDASDGQDNGIKERGDRSRAAVWFIPAAASVYLLLQMLCCQAIMANRYVSNTLDIMYAREVLKCIDEYEAETGVKITSIATRIDTECPNAYEEVKFKSGQINERVLAVSPALLLEYIRGEGISFEHVKFKKGIYNKRFKGKNWNRFDADEQLFFKGDTLYWMIF